MAQNLESKKSHTTRTDIVAKFFRIQNGTDDPKFGRKPKVDWLNDLEAVLVHLLAKMLRSPEVTILEPMHLHEEEEGENEDESEGEVEKHNTVRHPDEILMAFIEDFNKNIASEDLIFSAEPMLADLLYLIHQDCRYIETKDPLKVLEQFDKKRRGSGYCELKLETRLNNMIEVVDAVRKMVDFLFSALGRPEFWKSPREFLREVREFRRSQMVDTMKKARIAKLAAADRGKLENQHYVRCRSIFKAENYCDDSEFEF